MTDVAPTQAPIQPLLLPLGDSALLVTFGDGLSEQANEAAIASAEYLEADRPAGVLEVVPNLISVLLRYDPRLTGFDRLSGEVRIRLHVGDLRPPETGKAWRVPIAYDGPDLTEVAEILDLSVEGFVAAHMGAPLRVLATGFAPGFVYLGFHNLQMRLPRRAAVRRSVPAGSVLFAAGQTALAATAIPTGWHVIGHTDFDNFDADRDPPTLLRPGDSVGFVPL